MGDYYGPPPPVHPTSPEDLDNLALGLGYKNREVMLEDIVAIRSDLKELHMDLKSKPLERTVAVTSGVAGIVYVIYKIFM
jgi:hypothetical protein